MIFCAFFFFLREALFTYLFFSSLDVLKFHPEPRAKILCWYVLMWIFILPSCWTLDGSGILRTCVFWFWGMFFKYDNFLLLYVLSFNFWNYYYSAVGPSGLASNFIFSLLPLLLKRNLWVQSKTVTKEAPELTFSSGYTESKATHRATPSERNLEASWETPTHQVKKKTSAVKWVGKVET